MKALRSTIINLTALLIFLSSCASSSRLSEGQSYAQVSGGQIWYHVIGSGHKTPVLMLHGGPGGTSYSLYALDGIAKDHPIVIFDQIGSGRSSTFSDTTKMTMEYHVEQLNEFIDALGLSRVILYGHSWGTMLSIDYYMAYPEKVKALVLNSPLASTDMWMKDAKRLIALLPDSTQKAIEVNEKAGSYDSPSYQQAIYTYYRNYILRTQAVPNKYNISREPGNNLMYNYMWGPSEFHATGTLINYDRLEELKGIKIPVLWLTGEYDEATPETVEYYHQLTPNSEFQIIPDAGHATMHDNQEENTRYILDFLKKIN